MMPGGLSNDIYIGLQLRQLDSRNYSAAGILPYRRREDTVEFLLPKERPWNSFSQAYDPISWNLFGGKRVPRQEVAAEETAVRCFLESVGHVEGAPSPDALYSSMQDPNRFVLWYPMGKFALVLCELKDDLMSDLPERFQASRREGPLDEYLILPNGIKKWSKQIEAVDWVKGSSLVPNPTFAVSDLLGSILGNDDFSNFVAGKNDPLKTLPPVSQAPVSNGHENQAAGKAFGGKGKGAGRGKGMMKGGEGKGLIAYKGNNGKDGNAYGGGYGGGYKGYNGMGNGGCKGDGWGVAKGGKGAKGFGGCGMPGKGNGKMYDGKGGMAVQQPMYFSAVAPPSAEMQRQMYGEQLYLLVSPLADSPYHAQKITGMLLELPENELLLNLTSSEELQRRVSEALEVLKEDGVA